MMAFPPFGNPWEFQIPQSIWEYDPPLEKKLKEQDAP